MAEEKTEDEAPKKKSKLPIIIIALVLLLGGGGGAGWYFFLKPNAEQSAEAADGDEAEGSDVAEKPKKRKKRKKKSDGPRQFVNLEPFTVNLKDKDQDRFAQIGVTFEVEDADVESEINALSPAIRNAILMLITSKTAVELLTVDGKKRLGMEMATATNAILDGEDPPPIISHKPVTGTASPLPPGVDPNNRYAPPEVQAGVPGQAPPSAQNPYGAQPGYGQTNPYGAPQAFDAYGRPISLPGWVQPQYDFTERVEATHFSAFIIQ